MQAVFSAVFVRGVIRVFGTLQQEFSAWNEGSGYFHVAEARAGTRELWLMEKDKSIPVLPSRSLERTIRFYSRLGFEGRLLAMGTWAIVTRGDLELHFFPYPQLQPAENYGGCYLRVSDVDGLAAVFGQAELPRSGIPRVECVEDKVWRMREFALIDEDGNLVRIGRPI